MASNCGSNNLSEEHVINTSMNKAATMQPELNQTAEETRKRLEWLASIATIKDDKYYLFNRILVGERVSEWAKRVAKLPFISITKDNEIQRIGGTFIHEVLARLVKHYDSGRGNDAKMDEIESFAMNGPVKLTAAHVSTLKLAAQYVINDIKATQDSIEKGGKYTIHVENFVMDFLEDKGGTIDVIAVFSDNTATIYDWKSTGRKNTFEQLIKGESQINNPFSYTDLQAYELSQGAYSEILTKRIGVKSVRKNRLIPLVVQYKEKTKEEGRKVGDKLKPEMARIVSVGLNKAVKPIPTGGEQSPWQGMNVLLEKQLQEQEMLSKKLRSGKYSYDEKEEIKKRIEAIDKNVVRILVDQEIDELSNVMRSLVEEVSARLNEEEFKKDGSANPRYMSLDDLNQYSYEMNFYNDVIDTTRTYFEDLEKAFPDKFKKMRREINKYKDDMEILETTVKAEIIRREELKFKTEYKDEKGHLLPMSALSFGQLNALRISEINNPIFQKTWEMVQRAQFEVKEKLKAMDKKMWPIVYALYEWADKNKISRQAAYDMLINQETGNMYTKLEKGFFDALKEDLSGRDNYAVKVAKENFDFRDKAKWKKEYEERLENFKKAEKARHSNLKDTVNAAGDVISTAEKNKDLYEEAVVTWINNNDLEHSPLAWTNDWNRRLYLKLKDSVVVAHASPEYKKIMSIKPLNDFYNMWHEYMEEFSTILGIHSYKKLPPNYIPNVRKEFIEHMNSKGINAGAMVQEFWDSFSVREEDIYRKMTGSDGFVREIPILFMNKFFNKDGTIDNSRKSFELAKNLMLFAKMAYNYEAMSKIEADVYAMKMILGFPTPEQGGIIATDNLNLPLKGRILKHLTEEGRLSDTYKLYEDLTDYYLYGIKFKEKSAVAGLDLIHAAQKLKSFNSTLKLGLAIIPSSGAYIAGKAGSIFTGAKGIVYDNEQYAKAWLMHIREPKKYQMITKFFDAQNDDFFERESVKYGTSLKNRYLSDRFLFMPLRGVDKNLVDHVVVSMVQNWGVNEDGTIFRFTKYGKERGQYKDTKSILDLIKNNDKGETVVEGLSDEGYIQFRAAVKTTMGEIIGNMNPDDAGKIDVSFVHSQAFSFKGWIPAVVMEYMGDLRWEDSQQAMRWGRFKANLADYGRQYNFTKEEIEQGKWLYSYMSKVFLPLISRTILDITTFGLVPSIRKSRINEKRSRAQYDRYIALNPNMREKVSYDAFLEIKEAQIKAALMQIRFICLLLAAAMWLGGEGDDGEPRYYANFVTRFAFKALSKAGSELTFMWNPTEFLKLMANPFPVTSLLVNIKKTIGNGFDETRDLLIGENTNGDKTPFGYYMVQWIYGGPQLSRFLELYESMKKNPYQVFSMQTQ